MNTHKEEEKAKAEHKVSVRDLTVNEREATTVEHREHAVTARELTAEQKAATEAAAIAHEDEVKATALSKALSEQAAAKDLKEKRDAEDAVIKARLEAEEAAKPDSPTKASMRKLFDAYALKNPVKAAAKKEEFARKLAAIK